jgi:hypothetical protein
MGEFQIQSSVRSVRPTDLRDALRWSAATLAVGCA